jgi:beta-glucanase (GH16 family)
MARNVNWGLLALGLSLAGCNPPGGDTVAWVDGPLSFDEQFDAFDATRWRRSDGWASSEDFNAGWRADHVAFSGGTMELRLDTASCPDGCSGRPYAAGEVASARYYGYGRYEVRMKPSRAPGTLTSFSIVTGPFDWTRWDEIDMSFLGANTKRLRLNYLTDYTNDQVRHETGIDLPFDASEAFHTYGIEWTRTAVHWYVDGERVHTESGSNGPLPAVPGRILMNFWPGVGPSTESWMGHFDYPGTPLASAYEGIRYGPASPTEVLEDFELQENWPVNKEPGGQIITWNQEGHFGKALVVSYWVNSGQANIARTFAAPQDWRGVRYVNFWLRGTATGDTFRLELRDNGSSADTAERFEYKFQDDFVGWKFVSVPMSSFTRRTDWQPAGAPNDGLTLTSVRGLAFQPLKGDGNTILLDEIQLER